MYPEFSSFSVAGDFNENSFFLRIVDAVRWVEKKGKENTYTLLFFYSILAMKRKRKIITAEMNTVKRRNLFYIGEKTSS